MTSYAPAEVENLTRWTPEGQRDLRRKGYLGNYGFQRNGRWRYSPRDIAAFWLASELHGLHLTDGGCLDLRTLFAVAWTNAPMLIDLVHGNMGPKFVAVISLSHREDAKNGMVVGGSEVTTFSDTSELDGKDFDDAYLINFGRLATTAPACIKKAVTS